MVHHLHHRTHRACFGIAGAVYEALHAGVHHGASTHGAGLDGDVDLASCEAMVSEFQASRSQRHDFRMGGRVKIEDIPITGLGDHLTLTDHDCSYRDFTVGSALAGQLDRMPHPPFVAQSVAPYPKKSTFS